MKILLYYDGTQYEKDALAAVKRHAQGFRADVDVISSIPLVFDLHRDMITEMRDGLSDIKAELEKDSIPCSTHFFVMGNYTGEDVIRFVEENGVDEIIVNAEKTTRARKLIQGSVVQYLVLNADCPVTIV